MPQPQDKNSDEIRIERERLQAIINRSDTVINGLEHNQSWETVVEDFSKEQKRLDDSWQYVTDEKKWFEMRITKLATMKILNLIGDYKADKELATRDLFLLENPDKAVQKDVDNS